MYVVLLRHTDFDSDLGADALSTIEAHGPFESENLALAYATKLVGRMSYRTLTTEVTAPIIL